MAQRRAAAIVEHSTTHYAPYTSDRITCWLHLCAPQPAAADDSSISQVSMYLPALLHCTAADSAGWPCCTAFVQVVRAGLHVFEAAAKNFAV